MARVVGIKLGLPLIRAANTGISAVYDPLGRLAELPLGIRAHADRIYAKNSRHMSAIADMITCVSLDSAHSERD
jgi:apolipoprotein N-acyltransferase